MNDQLESMIKSRFEYDPEKGLIEKDTGAICAIKHLRYAGVRVRTKNVAWWMHTGEWPEVVRALDGDYSNLRFDNLTDTLLGEKPTTRKERLKVEAEEAVKRRAKERAEARLSNPLVILTFNNGIWWLKGPGVNAEFKRFKSAMSALTDLYYTCAKLEDKPM